MPLARFSFGLVLILASVALAQPAPTAALAPGAPPATRPATLPASVTIDGKLYPTNPETINTAAAGILGLKAIDIPRYTQTGPIPDPLPAGRLFVLAPFPRNPNLPTVWTIGDSTVRCGVNGTGDDRPGQWGWGTPFVGYFDPKKVNIVNRAVGGTTSGSFYNGQWKAMVDLIKRGDVVILQFGTNSGGVELRGIGDETQEIAGRGGRGPTTGHSFGWFIRQFIAETRAKGATPVVCSLIPRRSFNAEGKTNRPAAGTQATWAREVAAAEKADFIDLNELVSRKYDAMPPGTAAALLNDGVHTTWEGAVVNAEAVISGLKALKTDPVAAYYVDKVKEIEKAPTITYAPSTQPAAAPAN